jgi:hypothetical protein
MRALPPLLPWPSVGHVALCRCTLAAGSVSICLVHACHVLPFQSGPSKEQFPALLAGGLERREGSGLEHAMLQPSPSMNGRRRSAVADAIATQVPPPPPLRRVRLHNCCELPDALVDQAAPPIAASARSCCFMLLPLLGSQAEAAVRLTILSPPCCAAPCPAARD